MAALAVMAVVGCAEEVTQIFSDSTKVEVTASFSDTGRESLTRAADGLDNSTAGFSLTTSESSSSKVRVMVDANNGTYSPFDYTITNATTITAPATPPSFPSGVSTVNVYGWYPNVSLTNFSVNANQQSEANYCLSDLMVANSATCTRTGSSVTQAANLSFTHVMSKVKVSLTLASGVTVTAVKLKSILPQVTVSEVKSTNAVTGFNLSAASGSATDITLFSGSLTSASAAADKVLCGVFPPQSKNGAFLEITASYNSGAAQTITYSFGSAKAFARANEYTMNITLNGTNVTTGTVDISDWSTAAGTVEISVGNAGDAPTLSPTSLTLTYGGASGTITPTLAGATTFSGVSSNTGVATVSGTSTLTVAPVAAGTCTINVFPTNKTGAFSSATCNVTVNKAAQTVSLSPTSVSIGGLGSTQTFTVTRGGDGVISATVTSGGSNASVTDINQNTGVVTVRGDAAGSAIIRVTVAEGTNHMAYSANDKTVSVTVTEYPCSLANSHVGDIIANDGLAYNSLSAVTSASKTAVAVVGYKSGSSGYAIALVNSTSQTWNEITNSGANKNVDCTLAEGKRGDVPAAPTGTTWKVLNKTNYEAMFVAMGSTTGDNDGKTYDANVNNKITAAGGTALSGNYWSTSEYNSVNGWYFYGSFWLNAGIKTNSFNVRPVLAW